MEKTTIGIAGMSCGGCTASVTKLLEAMPGVLNVEVRLTPGQAIVEFDPQIVPRAALCAAINDAGFEAE